jgi:calpain-7
MKDTRKLYSGTPLKEVQQFKDVNEVCASFELESGINYIVMPCTLQPNCVAKFTLSAFSKFRMGQDVQLSSIDDGYTTQLEGEWLEKKAGGSPDFETWKYNPRFLLFIEQDCDVRLVLVQKLDDTLYRMGINVISEMNEMVLETSSWKQSRVVELRDMLQPGKYFVVPSTYYPQEFAPFSLICHSSRPHRFKKK